MTPKTSASLNLCLFELIGKLGFLSVSLQTMDTMTVPIIVMKSANLSLYTYPLKQKTLKYQPTVQPRYKHEHRLKYNTVKSP